MMTRQQALAQLTSSGRFEIVSDTGRGYPLRVYRNTPSSLRALLEESVRFGDLPYLIFGPQEISFREHYEMVAALASRLRDAGVRRGDRVAIGMRNLPEWVVSFWACQALGAISVSLNAWWTGEELDYALSDSEPAALLVDGERLERLGPYLERHNLRLMGVARRGDAGPGGRDFRDLVANRWGARLSEEDLGHDDVATILYTSGTTGRPKGAMATHRNHLSNLMNSLLSAAAGRMLAGMPAEVGDPVPGTQAGTLQTFPFFHIAGLSGLVLAMATGGKQVLLYKWSAPDAVSLIEEHRLTSTGGVPLVVRELLEEAARQGCGLESLVGLSSGGAPVPPDLIGGIGERYAGRISPTNGYGLTETSSAVIINSGADYLARPTSVGRPQPTADIRIVLENGVDAQVGEVGEIWVRGPNVIEGYWRDPEGTEAAFGGGWFRTGDLGHFDEDGFYYVDDRKKDIIIRGGENVYCAEVEAALLAQPEVADAAVIGVPCPTYGEEVAALVRLRPGVERQALAQTLRKRLHGLARFKMPTKIGFTEDELPRNATGKILKRELRERALSSHLEWE